MYEGIDCPWCGACEWSLNFTTIPGLYYLWRCNECDHTPDLPTRELLDEAYYEACLPDMTGYAEQ